MLWKELARGLHILSWCSTVLHKTVALCNRSCYLVKNYGRLSTTYEGQRWTYSHFVRELANRPNICFRLTYILQNSVHRVITSNIPPADQLRKNADHFVKLRTTFGNMRATLGKMRIYFVKGRTPFGKISVYLFNYLTQSRSAGYHTEGPLWITGGVSSETTNFYLKGLSDLQNLLYIPLNVQCTSYKSVRNGGMAHLQLTYGKCVIYGGENILYAQHKDNFTTVYVGWPTPL